MSKNTLLLGAVFIGAALLSFLLTRSGCNSNISKKLDKAILAEPADTNHADHQEIAEPASSDVQSLLKEAYEAVYGEGGGIMEGVSKYKQVLELDSNNLEANYQLGILSIKSNQLEKAKIRFKKLILLQPENQEYKDQYQWILDQLGE